MSPLETMARALAGVRGDPDELVTIRSGAARVQVPLWTTYQPLATAAIGVSLGIPDGAAISDVIAERGRQVGEEGYTPERDDSYAAGELARAGAAYAYQAGQSDEARATVGGAMPPHWWPWANTYWKPRDRRSGLVRAAALLIAEIGKGDRAAASAGGGDEA
jgi:hypothetical protein